jgi:YVTN family beta-propeller protein
MVNLSTAPVPLDLIPNDVAMSTDGRRLYVTCPDSTGFVLVLDTESHTVTDRIDCPEAERVVIAPDGRRLYVTSPGRGTVSVIDTGTHTVTRTISIGNMPLNLAVTPDGARVYVTADPGGAMLLAGLVAVIDTASEKVIRTFRVGGRNSAVAVAPDGERVYVADSKAGTVRVIDAKTDTVIGEPIPVGRNPRNLVVTPDSRRVVVLGDGIRVIDAATTTVTAAPDSSLSSSFPEPARDIVVDGDGSHAYVSCMDMVFVVDTKSGEMIRSNIRLDGAPGAMAITPDGHRAYAAASLGQQLVLPFDTMADSMPVGKRPEAAALSPDGKRLYVANSGEGTVGVIETRLLRVEVGAGPRSVCVTPDGLRAYAANAESGDVSLIEIPLRRGTIEVGSADVLAMSPDGQHVYVAGKGVLSAIDTTTQDFTANEVEQMERPSAVGVSPDNTRVYVADFSAETITAFDARTLDVIGRPIPVGPGCPTRLAVAPDGRVYFMTTRGVSVMDGMSLEVTKTIPIQESAEWDIIAVSPDGGRLYVRSDSGRGVSVIDTDTFAVTGEPIPVRGHPTALAVSPDGGRLYVGCLRTLAIQVFDTATRTLLDWISTADPVADLALSPDGLFAYAPNGMDAVHVPDTRTLRIPVGGEPRGVAVAPDSQRVYVVDSETGTVSVIDTTTLKVSGTPIPVGEQPRAAALTPDGERLYVSNSASDTVTVIDTTTLAAAADPIPVGSAPSGLAIAPDGTRAYVANSGGGTVSVIDTDSNTVIGDPVNAGVAPSDVTVAPDGTQLFVADSGSREVLVIDTGTMKVTGAVALPDVPHGLALARDGRSLLVTLPATDDLAVVDTATLQMVGTPIPVGGSPHSVCVSPDFDGRAYVANAASNTVSVVDDSHLHRSGRS